MPTLVIQLTDSRFTYEGMDSKIQATPNFSKTSVGFVNVDHAATQVGPSRWQSGFTEIAFEFSALVDCDAFSEPLQALIEHDAPIDGWPKCFVLAFKVLQEIAWQLRLNHGGEKSWIPTPSDFEDIEWTIRSSSNPKIEWKRKGSPTALIRAFTPSTEILNLNLGPLEPTKWSVRCRSFAIMYFEIGQTNEAVFWLNVVVEAVFEEGFIEIAEKSGKQNLEVELNSPKAFWGQAEDIVIEQFPDMAGKINWPDTEMHISIFTKLKYLYKIVEMKTKLKELTKRYSKIKSHRNDLFHGRASIEATVEDVRFAIACFDWIASNFDIKDQGTA